MKNTIKKIITITYSLLFISLLSLLIYSGDLKPVVWIRVLLALAVSYPAIVLVLRFESGERNKLIEKIYFDRQTALPNREKLRLDALHEDSILFLINIDSFKEVNDFYGNHVGDIIIQAVAARLKELFHSPLSRLFEGAQLYKLVIDEYAFLFSFSLEDSRIRRTAEAIVEQINGYPFQVADTEITITITLGVASVSNRDLMSDLDRRTPGILAQADMALRKAKEKRVPYLVYHHSMDIPKEYEENIRWTHEVRQSIKDDRVVPYFQPIINNGNGKIEKYECLMRIIDDEENIIYPEKFLKVSKRSRQYPFLSRIMLRKIVHEMKSSDRDYSFNISVDDIQNRETVLFIKRILENNWKVAPRICFEILESENIEGVPEVPEFIDMVKDLGCSIALDDFGTGYSNFNYIMSMNVDIIKIDASIIRNLDRDENAVAIAQTIVDFARRTGTITIAEYVHSKAIYEIVKSLGIGYSQGFYLGEPVPSSSLVSESTESISL